ncbi:hypothetical protein HK100_008677 [Physocladia obscura]|uniref:Uncharacterized protein n=1 Tax=Physocladia obscura TaxID=109957 RepID=A0AAD5T6P8_9FUNG|nr:hypothetical protein HK100_008677 [Physocladia obscura]
MIWIRATDDCVSRCYRSNPIMIPSFKEWTDIVCGYITLAEFLDSCDPPNWHNRFLTSVKNGGFVDKDTLNKFAFSFKHVSQCIDDMNFTRKARKAGQPLAIAVVAGIGAEEEAKIVKKRSLLETPEQTETGELGKKRINLHAPEYIEAIIPAHNSLPISKPTLLVHRIWYYLVSIRRQNP